MESYKCICEFERENLPEDWKEKQKTKSPFISSKKLKPVPIKKKPIKIKLRDKIDIEPSKIHSDTQ